MATNGVTQKSQSTNKGALSIVGPFHWFLFFDFPFFIFTLGAYVVG
jgi:hypothetical protein